MVAIPKKAATVILLRDKPPRDFEVFLLKRHEKSSFFGGNFVYPGGRVDPDDGHPEICARCSGISPEEARRVFGNVLSEWDSLGFWVAGIRELFEEAGVLLAYNAERKPIALSDPASKERLTRSRQMLQEEKITFSELAKMERIHLALDQLRYYAHWITPEARSERFDTRFFLARHPEGQEAIHDCEETTVGVWLTPARALQENLTGEVILSPPTLKTLEDLSRFQTTGDLFDSLNKGEITPILPVLTKVSGEAMIVFPWDPEFEAYRSGETSGPVDHGRPSRPGDNSTRVVFREGRWHPYCRLR